MKLFETLLSVMLFAAVSSMVFPVASSTFKVLERYRLSSKELSDNRFVAQSFRQLCRSGRMGARERKSFIEDLSRQHLASQAKISCVGYASDLTPVMELTWLSGGKTLRLLSLCAPL